MITKADIPPVRFTVVVDNREKPHNRLFTLGAAPESDKPIIRYEAGTVKTGDYIIQEAPDLVCIEKKQDGKELYTNIMHDRERLMAEFERMKEFRHKWIVFQQTYEEFRDPRNWVGVKDPKKSMAIVEGWLMALVQQGIQFIFAGKHADHWVKRVFVKQYDKYRKELREELKRETGGTK
jgi:hypothetical protein